MLRAFLMVALGGAAGSMSRYGVGIMVNKYVQHTYPFATFLINILGCFLIGLLFGLGQRSEWMQTGGWALLATGFCGGFTTFSSFALENMQLMQKQYNFIALLYTALSIIIGILLCKTGYLLTKA
jgi:CrcB protein